MNSKQQSWLNPRRALATYAAVFSIFIIWASLRTAINPTPHGVSIQYLAVAEIAGAILFVFRRTRFLGLAILLAVFAIAATIELHLHELPLRFVFYAASALFVNYLSVQPNRSQLEIFGCLCGGDWLHPHGEESAEKKNCCAAKLSSR